jgi:hypothetical protein
MPDPTLVPPPEALPETETPSASPPGPRVPYLGLDIGLLPSPPGSGPGSPSLSGGLSSPRGILLGGPEAADLNKEKREKHKSKEKHREKGGHRGVVVGGGEKEKVKEKEGHRERVKEKERDKVKEKQKDKEKERDKIKEKEGQRGERRDKEKGEKRKELSDKNRLREKDNQKERAKGKEKDDKEREKEKEREREKEKERERIARGISSKRRKRYSSDARAARGGEILKISNPMLSPLTKKKGGNERHK